MGRVCNVKRLPENVRAEVDRRLIESGFSGYQALEDDLRARGYSKVSKSSLHRYGKAMEARLQIEHTAEELTALGIGAELTAELSGSATLVVVIDRRNQRARLVSVPVPAAEVIQAVKRIGKIA